MAQKFYSWRDELREVADIPSSEPETEDKSERKIKETNVKNKIKINPTMGEAFEAIGGTILEVVELDESDMGDVVKDFYKSDAPQFKGKSKEKRREMAIAAKLQADED